jgi:hypothetical protein
LEDDHWHNIEEHLRAIRGLLERYVSAYERHVDSSARSKQTYEKHAEGSADHLKQHREYRQKVARWGGSVLVAIVSLAVIIATVAALAHLAR